MSEKHFVVQGARCKCQNGDQDDEFEVISGTEREYVNDNGAEKLIGSNIDLGLPFKKKTFGRCLVTRSACVPSVTEWKDFYKNVTLTKGGKILTEESKAMCATGGAPCITFITHGQTAEVTAEQMAKGGQGPMSVLNPLAKPPAPGKELPKIKQIQADISTRKTPLSEKSAAGKSAVPVIKMAVNEKADFKVIAYYNIAKADKSKVSWKIINGHSFADGDSYMDRGETLSYSFSEPGKYRVLAFGNEATQNDAHCCIDIEVIVNKLKNTFTGEDSVLHAGKGGSRMRKGVAVAFNAAYELEPTAEDKQLVYMMVTDDAGNVLAGPTEPGTDTISFTAPNAKVAYRVIAIMNANALAEQQKVEQVFTSETNSISSINKGPSVVRPGTPVTFSVKDMTYKGAPTETEKSEIKWQLNGRPMAHNGSTLELKGTDLMIPGDYVVEAYVMSANAWNAKAGKASKADEDDDWRFKVSNNKILSIAEEKGRTNWIIGKSYRVAATTLMPYDTKLDGPIVWQSKLSTDNDCSITTSRPGKTKITALMGKEQKEIEINASYAAIERWCFTDAQGVFKKEAGWNETVNVSLISSVLAGESVNIHLLDYESTFGLNIGGPSYVKDLGEVVFDKNGEAKVAVSTNEIKKKPLFQSWTDHSLLFAVLKKDKGFEFADTKTLNVNGKALLFPKNLSVQTDKETGQQLSVSSATKIVSVRYLDADGSRIYRVLKYGEKVRMHVQTKNLAKTKVKLSLYLNVAKGEDKLLIKDQEYVVRDDETLLINIDTGKLKSSIAESQRKNIAMFYVVLREADGDRFMYPEDLSLSQTIDTKKVNFYHHLKISEAPENTNKQATANAPVVLGEPLESSKGNGKCLCKEEYRLLIWGRKVSCEFRKKVVEISKDLWPDDYLNMANNLMAVFAWESGGTFKSGVPNQANSGGTGLIQFMPPTAKALLGKEVTIEYTSDFFGKKLKRVKEFAEMTEIKQLDYVKKHFEPLRGKKVEFVDFYLQVLFPASSMKEDHIVFANTLDKVTTRAHESDKLKKLRVTAYDQNSGLDGNSDGIVWKSEIKDKVQKYTTEGEAHRETTFKCAANANKSKSGTEKWHDPVDNPQLRGWYAVWAPDRSIHSNSIAGRSKGKHDGIDLYAPTGTTLYACVDGEIYDDYISGSYGQTLGIKGEYNGTTYYFFYAHMSERSFKKGDPVKAGEPIGKSGKTGSSASALKANQVHLHFEVRTSDARTGDRVDPLSTIADLKESVNTTPLKENQP